MIYSKDAFEKLIKELLKDYEEVIKQLLEEAFEAGINFSDAMELNNKLVSFDEWYKKRLKK